MLGSGLLGNDSGGGLCEVRVGWSNAGKGINVFA